MSPEEKKMVVLEGLRRLAPWRADDRETWLHVGMALHSVSADLLPEWDDWSQQSEKYKPSECARLWKGFKPNGGVTVATLIDMAKQDSGGAWPAKESGFQAVENLPQLAPRGEGGGMTYLTLEDAIQAAECFTKGKNAETYEYQRADSETVLWIARLDLEGTDSTGKQKKTFRPIHRDVTGYRIGDPPGKLPLYRLRDLLLVPVGETIYITEGEKAADAGWSIGLNCTTSAHGAQSAHKTDWSPLQDYPVVLLPDNDASGDTYTENVSKLISEIVPSITIVELPGLPESGDLFDYVDGRDAHEPEDIRGSIEELVRNEKPSVFLSPGLVTVCAANIPPEELCWLWPARIARGKLCIIAGDPGLGKSFLTLDLAARVSRGMPWPDGSQNPNPPGDTLILSAEDGPADTIVPRLVNANTDMERVFIVTGVVRPGKPGEVAVLNLQDDLRQIEDHLGKHPNTQLVIIDPLSAYLGRTDSNNDSDVRKVLAPLASMADRHDVAVVGVMHLNKSGGGKAIYRQMGSVAFTAAARTAWVVTKDRQHKERRLFLQVKNNIALDPGGLGFRVVEPGRVEWEEGVVEVTADAALSDRIAMPTRLRDEIIGWLKECLSDGPVRSSEMKRLLEDADYNWDTVNRAKREYGIRSVKLRVEGEEVMQWHWELES